jgi:hypothetical protein
MTGPVLAASYAALLWYLGQRSSGAGRIVAPGIAADPRPGIPGMQ